MRRTNSQRWHAVDVTSGGDGPDVKGTNVALERQLPAGVPLTNRISNGRTRRKDNEEPNEREKVEVKPTDNGRWKKENEEPSREKMKEDER